MPASTSNLGIGITMFLRDEFSGPAAKIRAASNATKKTIAELYDDQLRYTRNLNAGLAVMSGAALVGLGRAIKKGAEFNTQLAFTGIVTGATAEQQKALGNMAQDLSTKFMFSSNQIVAGMKEMGKAGMGVKETMDNIRAAIVLAGSTDTDLAQTTDTMITTMKQWDLPFEKAMNVADMMAYAVNASVIDMPDLAEAMKYVGSTAQDTGVKIEETTAMIMTMGQAGIKGSMAGVAIENMLRYLGRAVGKAGTGQQKKALNELGMSMEDFVDQKGNMKSMVEVMGSMKRAVNEAFGDKGYGGVEKQNILASIFGVRGKRSASVMLRMIDQFQQYSKDISTEAPGWASKATLLMMEQLGNRIKTLGNQWKIVGQNLAEAISPIAKVLISALQGIGKALAWLFKSPFFTAGLVGFLTWITAVWAFRAVISGVALIYRQMQGAMISLSTSTILGFKGMTSAAQMHAMALRNVAASNATAAGLAGIGFFGGKKSAIGMNAAGRYVRTTKGIGSFVSGAVAARYASRFGSTLGTLGARASTTILGKLVGFLGGPLGIALSFIIPGLINLLIGRHDKSKKALEENTNAINAKNLANAPNDRQRYLTAIEFISENREKVNALQGLNIPGFERKPTDDAYKAAVTQMLQKLMTGTSDPTTFIINVGDKELARVVAPIARKELSKSVFISQ